MNKLQRDVMQLLVAYQALHDLTETRNPFVKGSTLYSTRIHSFSKNLLELFRAKIDKLDYSGPDGLELADQISMMSEVHYRVLDSVIACPPERLAKLSEELESVFNKYKP